VIYICIPAHDEERTIGVMLWKIRGIMAEFRRDYQILVVDDASTDSTERVLAPYRRILPLTVIRHERRRGYAASLETLLREAVRRAPYPRRDAVVTLQADFTEDPEDVPAFIRRIEAGADVVAGRAVIRDAPGGVRWRWRALGYLARRFQRPEGVTDPLAGFRAYRVITLRKALETAPGPRLLHRDGVAANVELLQAVAPHARRVDEMAVEVRPGRRQRPSRADAWRSAVQLVQMLTGRPASAEPLEFDGSAAPVAAGAAPSRDGRRRRGGRKRPPRAGTAAPADAAPAPLAVEGNGGGADAAATAEGSPQRTRTGDAQRRRRRGGRGRGTRPDAAPETQGE
jgi:hypothetical protein